MKNFKCMAMLYASSSSAVKSSAQQDKPSRLVTKIVCTKNPIDLLVQENHTLIGHRSRRARVRRNQWKVVAVVCVASSHTPSIRALAKQWTKKRGIDSRLRFAFDVAKTHCGHVFLPHYIATMSAFCANAINTL